MMSKLASACRTCLRGNNKPIFSALIRSGSIF
ncbi:MAG: hypothetical protein KBT74_16570 [Zhongshania sp.]|nr:hypothetical protein [Zhongshania sp.]